MSTVNPQKIPMPVLITDPNGFDVADVSGNSLHVTLYGATGPISISNPLPVNSVGGGGGGGLTNVNITEVGGAAISEGQTTMANSFPVVIASNQTPIGVTGSSNPAAGPVGSPPPADADFIGYQQGATGNLLGVSNANPLPVGQAGSTTANIPAQTTVNNVNTLILASNTSRKEVIVTNTGATVVYLGLGQTPTITAYHAALAACTTANDGTGGIYISDIWQGAINAICAVGGTACVCEET